MNKSLIILILVTLLLVIYLPGCRQSEEISTNLPRFESAECLFDVPPGQRVECGYLIVPEDRSQPDSPTIKLYVAIFKSQSQKPSVDPIVYLMGGPGGHAVESVSFSFESFAPFIENRDLVVFDQRGTGFSQPSLYCREFTNLAYDLLDEDLSIEEIEARQIETIQQCRNRFADEDINLSAYNSTESAADVNDLRLALGYQSWNVLGVSYGTRLALTAMRDFPEGIRSVILDSVYPPQVDLYSELPINVNRAFEIFFNNCAEDDTCNQIYPDLEEVYFNLVDEFNDTPVMLQVSHPLNGITYDYLLNGDGLLGFLFGNLYKTQIIPLLPKIIYDLQEDKYGTLSILLGNDLASFELVSQGMQWSVQCYEEIPFSNEEEAINNAQSFPEIENMFAGANGQAIYTVCELWDVGTADSIENEPVNSDIPTLILAGEYDPVTPPAWGKMASETLKNSHYYEFPSIGHGAIFSGVDCPISIALDFLDNPSIEPDYNCASILSGPDYILLGAISTQFEDEVFGISGVIPESWIRLADGVYARSGLGLVAIFQQRAEGIKPESFLEWLASELEIEKIPPSTGNIESPFYAWSLFEFEAQGLVFNLAITEENRDTLFIMLQSTGDDRDYYFSEVYLPAIAAYRIF